MTPQAALAMPTGPQFDPLYFLSQAGAGKVVTVSRKGEIVFAQGDAADSVFFILSGRVKLTVHSDNGREAVIGLPEAGEFFGECCLNGVPLRTATATAMEDSTIARIDNATMLATLRSEPAMAEFVMAYLLARNSRIEEDLVDQLFNPSEKRLARLLLILARVGDDGGSQPIDVDLSQETLADMIGTTRSRVSFFMNRFRRLGFISYDGRIQVHETLLNAMLSDKEPPANVSAGRPQDASAGG